MNEPTIRDRQDRLEKALSRPTKQNVQVVYAMIYLGPLLYVSPLIGVIMAYVQRPDAPDWLKGHYTWLIRTAWVGLSLLISTSLTTYLIIALAGATLTFEALIIGFVIGCVPMTLWCVTRMGFGLSKLGLHEPISNPTSWALSG